VTDIPTLEQVQGNVDLFCVMHAQRIVNRLIPANAAKKTAKDAESLITKALGILQGQGIYAMFLWGDSRRKWEKNGVEKDTAEKIFAPLIRDVLQGINGTVITTLETLRDSPFLTNLSAMLLAKRVMEQTLVYARYHAKAQVQTAQEAQAQAEQVKAGATDAKH
jgi:hypothetical protein